MKRLLVLPLIAAFCLFLAGCAKDNIVTIGSIDDNDIDISNTEFTQTIHVTFSASDNAVVDGTNDDFTVTVSGNHVTLMYSGDEYVRYELTGTATDGSFKLYSCEIFFVPSSLTVLS